MLEHQGGTDEFEDSVNDLPPGTKLMHGQYTIEQYLSSGGFGITYLARDSLNRHVVIKECFPSSFCRRIQMMVRPHSRENAEELAKIVALFTQEALSLARVEHPNIVGVHQVFEENNTAYMALDFVSGRDLQEIALINKIELQPEQVTSILSKLLDAIGHVHTNGLLHRDISPDNIIIRDDGEPVLIDFGAAREQSTRKTRVLSAMQIVKDGYSPQEFYVADSNQSPSCDLYSLAATFYHVILGERPPDAQRRITALASQEPDPYRPLLGMDTAYDATFCAVLDKALQVLPKDRVQSAEEWLNQLGHIGTKRRISKRVLEPEVVLPDPELAPERDEPLSDTVASEIKAPSNVTHLDAARPDQKGQNLQTTATVEQDTAISSDLLPDDDSIPADSWVDETIDKDADILELADTELASKPLRESMRTGLPSLVSIPNSMAEIASTAQKGGGGKKIAAMVAVAGILAIGGWQMVPETGSVADSQTAVANTNNGAAAPSDAAKVPEPTTVIASVEKSNFPNSGAPIDQIAAVSLPVETSPAVLLVTAELVVPEANLTTPDVNWPYIEGVYASETIEALPTQETFVAALPVTTDAPARAATSDVQIAATAPEVIISDVTTEAPVAKAQEAPLSDGNVELTVVSEGLIFASTKENEAWITTVVSAGSGTSLQVGDVIVADATTGAELNSPASLRAMLETSRSEGRSAIKLAIERNGTFRLEGLEL